MVLPSHRFRGSRYCDVSSVGSNQLVFVGGNSWGRKHTLSRWAICSHLPSNIAALVTSQ